MIFFSIRRKERENSPIYPIFTRLALEYIASVIMLTINDHVKIQLFIGYAGCTRRKWCVSKRRDSWIPWLGESQQKCMHESMRTLFSSPWLKGVHWVKWEFEIEYLQTELRFVCIESVILRDNEASIFCQKDRSTATCKWIDGLLFRRWQSETETAGKMLFGGQLERWIKTGDTFWPIFYTWRSF